MFYRAAIAAAATASQCEHHDVGVAISIADVPQVLLSALPASNADTHATPLFTADSAQSPISVTEPVSTADIPQFSLIDNDETTPSEDEMETTISLMEDQWCSQDVSIRVEQEM